MKKYIETSLHKQLENHVCIKHTSKNPEFLDIDTFFHEYSTAHNKKFDVYGVRRDFKLVF